MAARRTPTAVRRRLAWLAVGEVVAMAVLLWVTFVAVGAPVTVANVLGALAAMVLLAQGAAWWVLRLRSTRWPGERTAGLALYRNLRRWNPVGLATVLVVLLVAAATGPVSDMAAGLALWVLAVLEQVNYFHRQLMVDNRHDLRWVLRHGPKRATVARVLDETPARPHGGQ